MVEGDDDVCVRQFLCDHNGKPVERYSPQTEPATMEDDIVALLDAREADLGPFSEAE